MVVRLLLAMLCLAPCAAQAAQNPLDRSDPSVVEEELREQRSPAPRPKPPLVVERPSNPGARLAAPVLVGAIRIDGARSISAAAFAPVVDRYAGRLLSPAEIRALASSIADVARDLGYGLATAWVPEQRIANGVLRVNVDEGRIDSIEASGAAGALVRRMLAPLADGGPVRTAELERRLLLAGDVAGVSLGKARLVRKGGRNVLVLSTARDRTRGRAALDNWGSSTIGPVRAHLAVDMNGLAAADDRLTIGGVATPLDASEFHLVRAAYAKPLGYDGTVFSIDGYHAHSHPGGVLADRDIAGTSMEAALAVRHPFVRARAASLWGDLRLAVREARQSRGGARVRDDRLATLTAGASGFAKLGKGRARGRIALVQGLGILDATRERDPLASRRDGSAVFTKLEAWGQYGRPLGRRFSFHVEAEGQVASRALLSSEEMGLGGRNFLRGYDYRERSGDLGAAASAELRYDLESPFKLIRDVQLYSYLDGGIVGNLEEDSGGGALASAGGGLRLWLGKSIEAGLELGIPFDGEDPRLSVELSSRF